MTSQPFMQLYIADYLGDTRHLTTEQHGAYLLLLMTMWRNDGRLPNDAAKLARIAGVSARRWHLIAPEVMPFFTVEGDTLTQKRLEQERQKAVSKSAKRSASGKLGGEAKALKDKQPAVANATGLPWHSPDTRDQKEDTVPDGTDAGASRPDPDYREELWRDGVASLQRQTGKTEGSCRSFIGKCLKAANDDCRKVLTLIRQAEADRAMDAPAWISGALKAQPPPASAANAMKDAVARFVNGGLH